MRTLIISMLVFFPIFLFAQHSSIGISGGYTTNGYGGIAEYNYHFGNDNKSVLNTSIYFSQATQDFTNDKDVPYNNATLNLGYYYKALESGNQRFSFFLGGGIVIGYESLNNGKDTLDSGAIIDGESQTIYGGYVGGTLNYLFNDSLAISLVTNEFYHTNSDIGNFAFYAGLGLKLYIF